MIAMAAWAGAVLALAAVVTVLLQRDLRRRVRQWRTFPVIAGHPGSVTLRVDVDFTGFVAAMNRVSAAAEDVAKRLAAGPDRLWQIPGAEVRRAAKKYPNLSPPRRCRWCWVLSRLGLARHMAHGRHR